MSKGGGKQQTATQTNDPWRGQQPYLQDLFGQARGLYYGGNAPTPTGVNAPSYSGPFSGLINKALGQVYTPSFGSSPVPQQSVNPLYGMAEREFGKTISGDYMRPDTNPYLRDTVNLALDQTRSKVNSQFGGNNFGSSAHQEWLAKNLANTALPIYAQNYDTERGRQLAAAGGAPNIAEAAADAPWQNLRRYQSIVGGSGYGGTSQTSQPLYKNSLANAAGLGLGGYAVAGLPGAVIGGLAGLLS